VPPSTRWVRISKPELVCLNHKSAQGLVLPYLSGPDGLITQGGQKPRLDFDFDLILDLIAHALADEETSAIQMPHHQSVARQKSKLVADFGLMMHRTWARQLLDNGEC